MTLPAIAIIFSTEPVGINSSAVERSKSAGPDYILRPRRPGAPGRWRFHETWTSVPPRRRVSLPERRVGAHNRRAVCLMALLVLHLLFRTQSGAAAMEAQRFVLPNGVRLVLKPAPAAELVAISICVRTEPDRTLLDDAAGELVARTLFSSSLNRSQERLSASISQVGGSVETIRTAEHVNITCVLLPSQVREAVYLLCEVLKNSEFGALERTRAELVAEQARGGAGIADGLDVLRRELQARPALADLPFQRVTLTRADAYFRSRYVPDRIAIAVVGQFDVSSVRTAFRDSLADFDRPAARAIRNSPLYSHATNFPTRVLKQPGASGYALVALPAPPLADADYAAFVILNAILGEGHASRLFRRLRDARGIGYNVGAAWQASLSDPLVAYLQWEAAGRSSQKTEVKSQKEAESRQLADGSGQSTIDRPMAPETALRLLTAQIDGMVTEPPTEAEVARARSVAVGRERLRHERARDRAFLLAWYEAMGAGVEFDDSLPARLAAVSRDDVLRVARNYLGTRASILIVPGP